MPLITPGNDIQNEGKNSSSQVDLLNGKTSHTQEKSSPGFMYTVCLQPIYSFTERERGR